jgi:hypothetical protein
MAPQIKASDRFRLYVEQILGKDLCLLSGLEPEEASQILGSVVVDAVAKVMNDLEDEHRAILQDGASDPVLKKP